MAAILLLTLVQSACSPRQLIVGAVADEFAAQGSQPEEDLELAREASAFYLKISESLLRQNPGHLPLAEAVAAGFTQYAYAFVAFEAERIEALDADAAERLRRRAALLYRRAQRHAMQALESAQPGFAAALRSRAPEHWPRLAPQQAGLAYWGSAAWGGWISLAKDDAEVLADLPLATRLAQVAWNADPQWGDGSLTGLLGTYEAARPGGQRSLALRYFDQAIVQAGGRLAGPYVAKAEGFAQAAGDRAQFEALLHQALAVPEGTDRFALHNEVMRRRARWLLERADDLF